MLEEATLLPIGFALAASAACGLLGAGLLYLRLPAEEREYLDPVPGALKALWPLVRFFSHYAGERLGVRRLEQYQALVQKAGVDHVFTAENVVGLQLTGGLVAAALGVVLRLTLPEVPWIAVAGLAALGVWLPIVRLRDMRKRREKEMLRALPVYLDYITMAVEAGLNLTGALDQAVDKGPAGPLRYEFSRVLRDVRAGLGRGDALRRMADRLELQVVRTLVSTLIQAERMGASLGATLRIQADQRRVERFQRAEKQAMETPVKLLMPLVVFIFPVTFIILAFPIVMKFLDEGVL